MRDTTRVGEYLAGWVMSGMPDFAHPPPPVVQGHRGSGEIVAVRLANNVAYLAKVLPTTLGWGNRLHIPADCGHFLHNLKTASRVQSEKKPLPKVRYHLRHAVACKLEP